MSTEELLFLVFKVLGGMTLFVYGMHIMTHGLRAAAGAQLRRILESTGKSRLKGFALGNVVGFLAHSGAATTMIAGFINAGLMAMPESIPAMLGANVGTTLSMQLISFHIGHYCFIAISLGFIVRMVVPRIEIKEMGNALMGFGLLFLGMTTISESIAPHRDLLAPMLEGIDGTTLKGILYGVGLSALVTALITSSGAMIGLCFALVGAGVFTRFDQVFPIVLGSHIGTCIVALMASLSMNVEARRSAISHLAFNVLNVAMAVAAYPLVQAAVEWSSSSLSRQTANLHTLVMAAAALLILPFSIQFGRLMRVLLPSKQPIPEPSYLKEELLGKPEQAICAVIRELRRVTDLCLQSMILNGRILLKDKDVRASRLFANEAIINDVHIAMSHYLGRMTGKYLSRRQTLFVQYLDRCMIDIERIGDHLASIGKTSLERFKVPEAIVPENIFRILFDLFCSAKRVLSLVVKSLDPEAEAFQQMALEVLKARDEYTIQSLDAKAEFAGAVEEKIITPVGGYYLNRYVCDLDRLVKHAKSIALAERQPDFWIKRLKLDLAAVPSELYKPPPLVDPKDYLDQLHRESYFE